MAQFVITIKGLDRLKRALRKSPKTVFMELAKAVKASVNIIRPMMASETPFATGKLRGNIYARAVGLRGEVGPNLTVTPYAIFVHEGTRPHIIRPVNKKALYWPGAAHPVTVVQHPGTKANPFVERTAKRARAPVDMIFKKSINRIVNKLAIR